MEVTHNHNAKSQLAKLLATENITVQHKPDAKTAWFDVKNRVLCLPVWRSMSNDLYDLLVVHEVGHALDTPADGWLEAISDIAKRVQGSTSNRALGAVKGFLNVIEDARIDKRQKRRFPGARRNYVKGYQELIEKDFFGTKTRDINSMSFIDRLNIYCKGGAMLGIKFSPEEKKMLAEVEAAETFDEVLELTEKIFRWSKENQQTQDQPPGDFGMEDDSDEYEFGESDGDDSDGDYDWDEEDESEDGEGEGDDEESDEDSESGDTDGDDKGKSKSKSEKSDDAENADDSDEDGKSDEGDDSDDGEAKDAKSGDGAGGSAKSDSDADDSLPESETEKAWQKNQEDLIVHSNEEYIYVKIPRPVDYNRVVVDYKTVLAEQRKAMSELGPDWVNTCRQELMQFKADENASISFMVKEFEMRKSADEYSRTSVSKTGVIDTNKLHSYKYNDDLFRRITTIASGKNHGFVMFVDWSGSMNYNLRKTVKQLFSLVMFCKRVQIPFEVYTFRSLNYRDYDEKKVKDGEMFFTANPNELSFDNFYARNVLSSRMKAQELNDAMLHLYVMGCGGHLRCDDMGSTPLNECIGVADLIVNKFHAQSKVQVVNTIFLTDGQSDPISSVHKVVPGYGKKQKYILQDDITKKTYDIRGSAYSYSAPYSEYTMTGLLLEVLKERTGCNLIGFYINGDGFDSVYSRYCTFSVEGNKKAQNSYKNDGFFAVTSAGYDEYYILNPKMFNVSAGNLQVDSNTMTKNKMAKEFIKFSEKKAVSRVLLTRFVKRIAA